MLERKKYTFLRFFAYKYLYKLIPFEWMHGVVSSEQTEAELEGIFHVKRSDRWNDF